MADDDDTNNDDTNGGKPAQNVMRLPIPERLEFPVTKGSLYTKVRDLFLFLYNNKKDGTFREYLVAVGNKDAITKNMHFDRYNAVLRIREEAKKTDDTVVTSAPEGLIYKHMTRVMRQTGLGLKVRREQMKRLTQQG